MISFSSELLLALSFALPLFLIGVLSPGPAILAIMLFSAKLGRSRGLVFALGISAGSLFWGAVAALGLASLLRTYAEFTIVLRIVGGLYLLWLAFKSLRSAFKGHTSVPAQIPEPRKLINLFLSGLMLHLMNPKAIFVWLAVVSVGLGAVVESNPLIALSMVLVCWLFSLIAFTAYAVIFSSEPVIAVYRRCARIIDGICGTFFVAAGLKVISGR